MRRIETEGLQADSQELGEQSRTPVDSDGHKKPSSESKTPFAGHK
jgi:hypothetical protein